MQINLNQNKGRDCLKGRDCSPNSPPGGWVPPVAKKTQSGSHSPRVWTPPSRRSYNVAHRLKTFASAPKPAHRSGQILPLFVFLFLTTLGLVGVMLKVGDLAKERIVLQRSADAAAIGATRVQALSLEGAAILNDVIAGEFAKLMADLSDPLLWENVPCDIKRIENTKTAQDAVTYAAPVGAEIASISLAVKNGAVFGAALPTGNGSNLMLNTTRPIYFLTLFLTRKTSDYAEQVTVIAANTNLETLVSNSVSNATDDYLGTKHKIMTAFGSSKPYYVFANDPISPNPRSGSMNFLWQDLSMFVPGPFWNTRLVETPSVSPSSSKASTVFGLAKGQAVKKAYAEIKKQLLEDIGQEASCD